MQDFFGDGLFLPTKSARDIYERVKDLPIIDYHCHLDIKKIASDACFADIGELWLAEDHYKWRAMRMCGVDESYITGGKSFREKFLKFAEILPKLAGNPVYYWSHMELRQIFGISEPLNASSAERIYAQANKILCGMRVRDMFKKFGVQYVATTDDPLDDLDGHGVYGETAVCPTFRADKLIACDPDYVERLGEKTGIKIMTLADLFSAAEERLVYFKKFGCAVSDHGFKRFPRVVIGQERAEKLFAERSLLSESERDELSGYILAGLARLYKKYGIAMQLHFAVTRNVNRQKFKMCGADAGFDVIANAQDPESVIAFFAQISDDDRPETIMYSLNDSDLPALACMTGAFAHIKMGAAWWFNDTVEGIRKNLSVIAEYAALGTNYGMLTDSRSFSSYVRFDFFRRILCGYLGSLVENGELDLGAAIETARNVSYYNIKELLKL